MNTRRHLAPAALQKPVGYSHGIETAGGRLLFIAGQTAASLGEIETDDFVEQFDRALAAVLEVVRAAGGAPEDLTTFTIYVTDMAEYRASRRRLAEPYRKRMGRHFPCMAVIGATALFHPRARVEIVAQAVIGHGNTEPRNPLP